MGCKRASQHSLPESHQPQPAPPPPPMPDVHMSSLLPTQPVASPPQQQQELMEERPDRLRDELFAEKEGRVSECMILSVAVAISALVGWRARPGAVGMRLSSRTKLSERNNHLGRFYMFDLTQLTDSSPDPAKYAENLERMRAELTALIAALTASLGLHSGILVTTLIIIERMLRQGFPLSVETVRPTALTAILIACKEGFDEMVLCSDFRRGLPHMNLQNLHHMEREVLSMLDWNICPIPVVKFQQYSDALYDLLLSHRDAILLICQHCGDIFNDVMNSYGIYALDFAALAQQ